MTVEATTDRGRMTITLADEARRNALGAELVGTVIDHLERANADDEIRAVVLTNRGSVFSAGADLKARSADEGVARDSAGIDRLLMTMRDSPTPVVGRIDGSAFGGGVGVVAACDIALARDDARFGFTEVRLGLTPAMISIVCLPLMSRRDAMEVFLRGQRFTAVRAAELGLVNRAVPADELDATVDAVVDDLMLGGPNALAASKRLVNEVPRMDPEKAMAWATELSGELFASDEGAEGMASFREKRRPSWAPPE